MRSWIVAAGLALMTGVCHAEGLSLAKKAEIFQHDMEARFLLEGQALCKLKVPNAQRAFVAYNMPDNAYMTGIYVGALSMKYAVTGAEADREAARKSLRALHLLCTVSGKPGLLSRAAWPVDRPMEDDGGWVVSPDGKHKWRGDVSTDQVDGVLHGFSLAYDLVATDEDKAMIAADVGTMVGKFLEDDLRIIGIDGKTTQWGRYYPEYAKTREKLNALLWLQALKIAAHVTGEERFASEYRRWALDEGYAETAVKARRILNPAFKGAVNHSDDVLFFLGVEPLLRYEDDSEIRTFYEESLRRAWEGKGKSAGMKPEGNPLHSFLAAKYLGDESQVEAARNSLAWFPLDMKMNRATLAKYEAELGFAFDPAPRSPKPKPSKPIPIDRREKTWSAWVQDPYHSAGSRTADSPMEFNGHDYLAGYWFGRHLGYIAATE